MASPQAYALADQIRAWRDQLMGNGTPPSLEEQRAAAEAMGSFGTQPDGVTIESVDAGGRRALLHTPVDVVDGAILHLHGGGLVVGSPESHSRMAAHIAMQSRRRVFNLDFRLAPENPYPAARQDTRAAYEWLLAQGLDSSQIFLSGDSGGAALAMGTAIALRDEGFPLPAGLIMFSPWVDFTLNSKTLSTNAERDLNVPVEALQMMRENYAPAADYDDPEISPALIKNYRGLPPFHVQASEEEVLLGDALLVAQRASTAGVPVRLKTWQVVQHVFQLFAGNLPEADESIRLMSAWIEDVSSGAMDQNQADRVIGEHA